MLLAAAIALTLPVLASATLDLPVKAASPARATTAGISVFTDQQSFFQAANIVSTETFNEFPRNTVLGVGSFALDGITYTSASPIGVFAVSGDFANTPSPPNALIQQNTITAITLTFAGGGRSNAIGFSFLPGAQNYLFEAATASGEKVTVETGIIPELPIFRGFVSPEGIVSLTITPDPSDCCSNFLLDDVSHGVITFTFPFAGTPGRSNCHGQSVSALAKQYVGLNNAAAALGFANVNALQEAIQEFCGG
jgi:hypothetical protein